MCTQINDLIIDRGGVCNLQGEPLAQYKERPRFESFISSNSKGYEAIWAICHERLFLIHLTGQAVIEHSTVPSELGGNFCSGVVTLASLFPTDTGPVHAAWFTGALTIGFGRIFGRIDDEWLHHEYEDDVQFLNGNVVGRKRYRRDPGIVVHEAILYKDIENLEMPISIEITLARKGITRVGDLVRHTDVVLKAAAGLNDAEVRTIQDVLAREGMSLGMELASWPPPTFDLPELIHMRNRSKVRYLIGEN